MDKNEAKAIAESELESYRAMPYELIAAKIGYPESFERQSSDGHSYQVEFHCFYDDSYDRNIRVICNVSYSGWTYFSPVSDDFIIAPDGSFIGE